MPTRRSAFVLGLPGSGATQFAQLLGGSGVAGTAWVQCFDPVMEQMLSAEVGGIADWPSYLAYVLDQGTTANGMFAATLYPEHLSNLLRQLRLKFEQEWIASDQPANEMPEPSDFRLMRQAFPGLDIDVSFIYVWRADLPGQAVSGVLEKGRIWNPGQSTGEGPTFNLPLILEQYWKALTQHQAWITWIERFGIMPLYLKYEDLVADPDAALTAAYGYLGVQGPEAAALAPLAGLGEDPRLVARWRSRVARALRAQFPYGYQRELTQRRLRLRPSGPRLRDVRARGQQWVPGPGAVWKQAAPFIGRHIGGISCLN